MTLTLNLRYFPNSVSFGADYVKVFVDRPILLESSHSDLELVCIADNEYVVW